MILQFNSNPAQTITAEIALEDSTDNGGFTRVDNQFSIWASIIAIASALGHLGGSILDAFSQARPDRLAFPDIAHGNLSFPKIEATVIFIAVA